VLIKLHCTDQGGGLDAATLAEDLHRWLLDEPAARRTASVELLSGDGGVGELSGALLTIVQLVLGSGFSAGSLAVSIANWKRTSATQVAVTVEHGDRRITVTGADPAAIEQALNQLSGD